MLAVLVRAVLVGERGGESAYHVVAVGEQEELTLMLAVVVVEELTRVLGVVILACEHVIELLEEVAML